MEAMALKLPIIATRVAGQAEAVINDKNGYIVEPNNLASLVGAIKRLLAEPSKWETMGMNGYQRYRTNFLGEKSIEELFEKYYKQY
jgi:glycosyltransferase involved in cell wall biosynthesis